MTDARAQDPKQIVRDGYDRVSHVYRDDTFERFPQSGYAHWLKRLETRVRPGQRVLDLGCGNGIPVARELARRHTVTGVDLSPVQIERAIALVPEARFVCADMTTVEFEPGSFDAVVAMWSIINVPVEQHPPLFHAISRWLAPGGWLMALVGRAPRTGIEENWRGVAGATMYWSHAGIIEYRGWLAAAGFRIVEEGLQPEDGNPGFVVVIAQSVAGTAVANGGGN